MKKQILLAIGFTCMSWTLWADSKSQTHRVPQFENDRVHVWKTIIYPKQPLKLHRHDQERVVVALTDTRLTVTSDHGETHVLEWKKGSAHFLKADRPGEMHTDQNESDQPMEVMVIQFKEEKK